MNHEAREPCKTCPYRKDVARRVWHRSEFENLLHADADPFRGDTFLCHLDVKKAPEQQGFCVGWLLDQRERNIPSIRLRVVLLRSKEASEQMAQVHAPEGVELYDSIEQMCRANGIRVRRFAR